MYPGQALFTGHQDCYTEQMARHRIPPTLTEAVYRQEWERLDELLAQGEDLNDEVPRTRSDKRRATPLMVAVEQQNLPLIRKLVKAGADVNYSWSGSPMKAAIRTGNLDTVKLLHELGVPLGSRKKGEPDYLLDALGMGHSHPEIMAWLIEQGLDPRKENQKHPGWTLINTCLSSNVYPEQNRKTIDLLLDAGVDPRTPSPIRGDDDYKQSHPIASAVGHGDAHIVRRFLQAGCDPNLMRDDYIGHADGDDCPLIVTALLAKKVETRV
jgi:ankyrin repeat protein